MNDIIIDIDGVINYANPHQAHCHVTLSGVTFSVYCDHQLALQVETSAPVNAIYLTPGTYTLMAERHIVLKAENWGYRENRGDYRFWWRYTWDTPSTEYYPQIELLPLHPVSVNKH